jgi:hypothetical protein
LIFTLVGRILLDYLNHFFNLKHINMKKVFMLSFCLLCLTTINRAQNADIMYFNSLANGYDYQAASFVIDTALPSYGLNRAMLLWAANPKPQGVLSTLSLDEMDNLGVPLTQHINAQGNLGLRNLQPKKILRSRFTKHYYLLAHVVSSSTTISGFAVSSSAFVLKIDDNLNLVWSSKIHFATVTATNADDLIEYNDIAETKDSNIVIVGRYATSSTARQALQIAKLKANNGLNIWWYWYYLWSCHANGLSIIEASNGDLAVTGYAEQCILPAFTGNRQLLFARVRSDGAPQLFRKFLHSRHFSGDKISRFISVSGADRFFITGFIDSLLPTGATNRQNLVVDISQNGTINRASHYGDARNEEVNDHIFTKLTLPLNTYELYLTGYTNSYTSTGATEAYFNVLRYNSSTLTFTITRYDVIRNVYPGGISYTNRRGIEIKRAGPRRYAILINSVFPTTVPTLYNHTFSNVYVRDLMAPDTICHRPKTPPLVNFQPPFKDTTGWLAPNYKIYNENWTISPRIPYQLVCGTTWIIYPKQAVTTFVNPPEELSPDEVSIAPAARTKALQAITADALFPNPAGNAVTLSLAKHFGASPALINLRLLSPEMRLLRTERIGYQPRHTMDVSALAPGMYVVEAIQGNQRRVYRFVKE